MEQGDAQRCPVRAATTSASGICSSQARRFAAPVTVGAGDGQPGRQGLHLVHQAGHAQDDGKEQQR
ncbi:MAG: hypothetical protein M3P93_16400 [Actinomycetota bacterium]|nr:hypothetical protein [Actinomycetota bacterium]